MDAAPLTAASMAAVEIVDSSGVMGGVDSVSAEEVVVWRDAVLAAEMVSVTECVSTPNLARI